MDKWFPHIVRTGEHTSGLAFRHGCSASEVWEHPKNKELKKTRANPDVLQPGDLIWLPEEPVRKTYSVAPGGNLTVQVSVPKVPVCVYLYDRAQKPVSGLKYQVVGISGDATEASGGDGKISFMAPVTTKEVEVYFPERNQSIQVLIGALDPENTISGAISRLSNLEFYDHGPRSEEQEQEYRAHCLAAFQKRFKIPVTMEFDETTLKKIAEVGGHDVGQAGAGQPTASDSETVAEPEGYTEFQLSAPKVVAIAKDTYLTPLTTFKDAANLPGVPSPQYGQDITFGSGRAAPGKKNAGSSPTELIPKMRKLLDIFAKGDSHGMARRLFEQFLAKQSSVSYFDDSDLNDEAANHPNIISFMNAAVSAPNSPQQSRGKTRIHQALRNAGWDINKLTAPTDLGVPAFNIGKAMFRSGDFNNGLGVMINGVQHAYVVAKSYGYDPRAARYQIVLKYIFYDVFGLDDDDLREFGASGDSIFSTDAGVGITAWWQLQHQHGYAPLVTRIIVERTLEVPAT